MSRIPITLLTCAVLILMQGVCDADPWGPAQPKHGPGGSLYRHAKVRGTLHLSGIDRYWLFEPAVPVPVKPSPVIVLLHGWGGTSPSGYGCWIEHLVRQGNVVIFPEYQTGLPPKT